MDNIDRSLFVKRIQAICDEMGLVLKHTAFSPNIRDRQDFSCAVFDSGGQLCAQAAHIPVHLGSMAYAMREITRKIEWLPGDMMILNDPYLGGTHLPDVTVIAPIFFDGQLCAFVANRAHHADIGASTPGSMPVSTRLDDEGVIISPVKIVNNGSLDNEVIESILKKLNSPTIASADLDAQISANKRGASLLGQLVSKMGLNSFKQALDELNNYAERLAMAGIGLLPNGEYHFSDYMDDDGFEQKDIVIKVKLDIFQSSVHLDFSGTARQVNGNINCPLSVTAAAVYYCLYCLMPRQTPACAGSFRPITMNVPRGSLINAISPAAVAAGNVETSSRIVDVVLGALSRAIPELVPAASQGSMNNVAMGTRGWDYYETIAGGTGGNARYPGLDGVQSHMTNTLNTPIEILEMFYPVRVTRYEINRNSGGRGLHRGGHGLIREFEFLDDTSVSLLTERRTRRPWGVNGGGDGCAGINSLNGKILPGKTQFRACAGDRLTITSPGGGGWGKQ